jgi:hypothetical protein
MNSHHSSLACPNTRKLLENAYDQKRMEDAIKIGNIMDEMQCLLILNEQEEAVC